MIATYARGARVRPKPPVPLEPATAPAPRPSPSSAKPVQAATAATAAPAAAKACPAGNESPRRPHPVRDQAPLPVPRFWFVWGVGEPAPKRRHETLEGARGEARRLTEKVPGATFLVFAAELVESVEGTKGGEPS
jgi:hypothetical protein